jgi:hypothetical protein
LLSAEIAEPPNSSSHFGHAHAHLIVDDEASIRKTTALAVEEHGA